MFKRALYQKIHNFLPRGYEGRPINVHSFPSHLFHLSHLLYKRGLVLSTANKMIEMRRVIFDKAIQKNIHTQKNNANLLDCAIFHLLSYFDIVMDTYNIAHYHQLTVLLTWDE